MSLRRDTGYAQSWVCANQLSHDIEKKGYHVVFLKKHVQEILYSHNTYFFQSTFFLYVPLYLFLCTFFLYYLCIPSFALFFIRIVWSNLCTNPWLRVSRIPSKGHLLPWKEGIGIPWKEGIGIPWKEGSKCPFEGIRDTRNHGFVHI